MAAGQLIFYLPVIMAVVIGVSTTSKPCKANHGLAYLLRMSGIQDNKTGVYVSALMANGVDESLLGALTLQQLASSGINQLGDRIKIHRFFSNDGNDCITDACSHGGQCIDGFNCFYCKCSDTGYYGSTCQFKCPCKNGGKCLNTPTGFKCECAPGYEGKFCENKWLTEDRFTKLESQVKQLTVQLKKSKTKINEHEMALKAVKAKLNTTGWALVRVDEVLNKLAKLSFHQQTPTYIQRMPMCLPKHAKAIIVSVYFFYQGPASKHGYMDFIMYQRGNEKSGQAKLKNTHYDVHYNTFYYEVLLPWNSSLGEKLVVQVTSSYNTAVGSNWYQLKLVGYITA